VATGLIGFEFKGVKAVSRLTHIYEPGMTYLITTVTHHREKVFADTELARAAHEDITFYANKFSAISVAHVIMYDHLHWIMHPSPDDFERFIREEQTKGSRSKYAAEPERFYLSKILEDYKRHTAYMVNAFALHMVQKCGRTVFAMTHCARHRRSTQQYDTSSSTQLKQD
jgi:REP element-mobilizing transposase RayT